MLRAHLCLRTVSGAGLVAQQFDGSRSVSNSLVSFSSRFSFQLGFRGRHSRGSKSVIISCRASRGSSGDRSANGEDRDQDYLEAFVLISGEFSVEKLIDALREDEIVDCPNQFQFVRDLVGKLGYKVKMVKITERIVNTYFARIYFSKPGENNVLSVDARPSDAINVAKICKVPIYVNKQIILTDAIRIIYGMGRARDRKSVYDVVLDSAADGPDLLAEELDLVRNMSLAIKEERYNDAALWRDKLMKLRESRHEL